ncbi:unnamed protein product, partial [Vitis vinifera]|uniref:Uncharacterized protein n=1 Tax=Vitis vinifera TaxID=29760 RepID=D7TA87_VITVI
MYLNDSKLALDLDFYLKLLWKKIKSLWIFSVIQFNGITSVYSKSSRQSTSQSSEDGSLKGQNSSVEGNGREIEIQGFNLHGMSSTHEVHLYNFFVG